MARSQVVSSSAGSSSAPTAMEKLSPGRGLTPIFVFSWTVTPTDTAPGAADSVHFLGLDLTSQSAEIALYVLFALSVVGALGLVLSAFRCRKTPKSSHKPPQMELSQR